MVKTLTLKVKTKNGQKIVNSLTTENTIKDLKHTLSTVSNISADYLQVLYGFPPTVMDISEDDVKLENSGLATGDTLILQELSTASKTPNNKPTAASETEATTKESDELPGLLLKQVVPADNSCLFTSIHFVLNGKIDDSGEAAPSLRKLVAELIRNDKVNFDEAILGKSVDQYCTWIQNDSSWGGAIELAILSNYYGIEIAVVDTTNAIVNRFGEDQNYPVRVLLMFDGIHYDPLYLEPADGGKIQTMFESSDDRILCEAKTLAQEAKSSRQFTDVNKFTLKCLVCNIMMKGQTEAQSHAQQTGHANFGEV
ncbi:ubiquitin thioesterase OTU1 [Anthonomus grandis grandis]|uniref:ubiquitin thioesterase OTU1 n=1 Tax=Anthonomus grandis grandis TaxID=2921223 RepID=UPI002166BB85|nr:ubiquitin thioesterase OTU1 [Anthonomus grandis grandis]